jgi:hypothetical protein
VDGGRAKRLCGCNRAELHARPSGD